MTSPRLISIATGTPPYVVSQAEARQFAAQKFASELAHHPRLLDVFENAEIDQRHVSMPLEWFGQSHDFGEKNDAFVETACRLGEQVGGCALERAGMSPEDIDQIVFVTSTGLAAPSIDARLANTMGLREDVRRTPVWGLGCAGGAAGLALTRQLALGDPSTRMLLISLELCSLAFQLQDSSPRNIVASSLFADGAAAAVVVGADGPPARNGSPALELIAARSMMWKDTLDVMGWTVDELGLHVVFSRDIPALIRDHLRDGLNEFLESHGLTCATLRHLAIHPGGVKVLAAYSEALGLPLERFQVSREILREFGNMSSPTCLFVLERILSSSEMRPGDATLIAALGPGFSGEYLLARGA